ncbi:double-strand-break repair protein rad21 [Pyricularia oryzae 70-15]|uniref:Double-strand-break repair protein rad21 n=3 Tax=Pyricularia oryzae TaxID=318829 RepID=G4MR40_PYRO7|nr:double-strand-break repair protein rad21 [Pyricularia oryzae 70-15]EHA57372.1 double-strand-break repair protein rad21 [Pyricularia oryzae 70-15]ELQ36666.1 double-strand-break repair protein rad21 [Pyricularia oryzae Y34]KAI7928585.1 double-strand-break repair protein rad21 [Pyricularia oryzae]KAI7928734.1 double-strand-break repair protein rad21 [Pyricularia oryzae]
MFYSDTLLRTTGPLSRVWLAANMERKLSKAHILQSNLRHSVEQIIQPSEEAPLALRLSGQLLLGVVRIYSRKARYLLEDCNEALMKIKMAFRSSGNNDLPTNLHLPNRESLMLQDRITPHDNLDDLPPEPTLNFDDLTTSQQLGRKGRVSNREINLQEDFNNSQFLQDESRNELNLKVADMDEDLELDFGLDLDMDETVVETGRDAPAARDVEDDMISELVPSKERDTSLGLDFGDDEQVRIPDVEGDIPMFDDDMDFNIGDASAMPQALMEVAPERARISESPLSDIDPAFANEMEMEFSRTMNGDMYEPGDDTERTITMKAPQRAKKRRAIVPDTDTMLTSNHIRDQQAHHDNILKPQTFVPNEPYLLTLLDMQKSGGFVSNVILESRSEEWAPELKGLLSLESIRPINDLKRKRDSGIADMESGDDQGQSKSPRLELGEDDDQLNLGGDDSADQTVRPEGTVLEIPADEGYEQHDDTGYENVTAMPAFDDTVAPQTLPADSGPISIGTKHAVHILRDLFGPDAATDAEKRKNTSVVFQELLPETRTTKADATKMFFECLVLATKDAIKVEQPEGVLGGPIRIRGKRGLWGAWAEREAGGEMAAEVDEPEPAVTSAPVVSVEA